MRGPVQGIVRRQVECFLGPVLNPNRDAFLDCGHSSHSSAENLIDVGALKDGASFSLYCAHKFGKCGLHSCPNLFCVVRMLQQAADENIECPVVVMKIAVADFKKDLGIHEGYVSIAQPDLTKPGIQLLLCRSKGMAGVVIEGLCISKSGKPGLDRLHFRGERRADQPETLVDAVKVPIQPLKVLDDLLEFGGRYVMVFDLDMDPSRATSLKYRMSISPVPSKKS